MKPIKCRLILHGKTKEIDAGEFTSISAAKDWVKYCWKYPYTIKRIKTKVKEDWNRPYFISPYYKRIKYPS